MAIAQLSRFARMLRNHRLEARLTQEELAERAGLSARTISDLERGVKTRPHRVTVDLLIDALDLTAEESNALLSAVPRSLEPYTGQAPSLPDRLASSPLQLLAAPTVHNQRELRQVLEGLVGMYVDQDTKDRQINITVFMFSTGETLSTTCEGAESNAG